jgi:hypothetical protein
MTNNTGGPAFAVAELANIKWEGMTLRDYFAAKAMQAILQLGADSSEFHMDADAAYEMADAMLKAREE